MGERKREAVRVDFGGLKPEQLEAQLHAWLPRQRWFAAKAAAIERVAIVDLAALGPEAGWLVVEVTSAGTAAPARYQLLLSTPPGGGIDLDGAAHAAVRACWFKLLTSSAVVPTTKGRLEFEALAPGLEAADSRVSGAEQSNTSLLYADAAGAPRSVFKLFRRLLPGENPEFEIPRALAVYTSFRRVPAALGRVLYHAGGETTTLATMQEFIANQGDGWEYVLRQLRDGDHGPDLTPDIALLGRRTAELHRALGSIRAPGFTPVPIATADVERWRQRARAGAQEARLQTYHSVLSLWLTWLEGPDFGLAGLTACAQIRIHGDYHLGQVLKTQDDFVIFDFEGEPARPLTERRRPGCVLQDVAGMLRSLSYAAHTAGRPAWQAGARKAFLDSYFGVLDEAPASPPLVPATAAARASALRFFQIEKAVYELGYELNNRPDWVPVPLAGLRELLTQE